MKKERLRVKHNMIAPEKGKILIAEPFLSESYFQRSVIYMTEHNNESSMGFVVNKKVDFKVNEFFDELAEIGDIPIYCGGPVETNRLFYLHCLGSEIVPDSIHVGDGIYLDGDFRALLNYLIEGNSPQGVVKFFLGYSGWEKGQLLAEIEQDTWLVAASCRKLLFDVGDEDVWADALKQLDSDYSLWNTYPLDPNFN